MTKGERIRSLREGINMSQTELAEAIKVSKQTMYKYENDVINNIPSDKIELLAKALETTPENIMGWGDGVYTVRVPQPMTVNPRLERFRELLPLLSDEDLSKVYELAKLLKMAEDNAQRKKEDVTDEK